MNGLQLTLLPRPTKLAFCLITAVIPLICPDLPRQHFLDEYLAEAIQPGARGHGDECPFMTTSNGFIHNFHWMYVRTLHLAKILSFLTRRRKSACQELSKTKETSLIQMQYFVAWAGKPKWDTPESLLNARSSTGEDSLNWMWTAECYSWYVQTNFSRRSWPKDRRRQGIIQKHAVLTLLNKMPSGAQILHRRKLASWIRLDHGRFTVQNKTIDENKSWIPHSSKFFRMFCLGQVFFSYCWSVTSTIIDLEYSEARLVKLFLGFRSFYLSTLTVWWAQHLFVYHPFVSSQILSMQQTPVVGASPQKTLQVLDSECSKLWKMLEHQYFSWRLRGFAN